MKKKLLITFVSLTVFCAVAAAVLFIISYQGKETGTSAENPSQEKAEFNINEKSLGLLRLNALGQIKQYVTENEISLVTLTDEMQYCVEELDLGETSAVVFFDFGIDGGLTGMDATMKSVFKHKGNKTGKAEIENARKEYEHFITLTSALFDCDTSQAVAICSTEDGKVLNDEKDDTYKSLLSFKAKMQLYVRDENGALWFFYSYFQEEDDGIAFNFSKTYSEAFKNTPADIDLSSKRKNGDSNVTLS